MKWRTRGFSLIEVVLAMGIIVFAFVAIFGVFPIGIGESRASAFETRSAQLAHDVFATLNSRSFGNVNCYGLPLNLGTIDDAKPVSDNNNPQFILYADFPVSGQPVITPDAQAPYAYRIGLWFHKIPDATSRATPAPIMATRVTLLISSRERSGLGIEFQSIVGNY